MSAKKCLQYNMSLFYKVYKVCTFYNLMDTWMDTYVKKRIFVHKWMKDAYRTKHVNCVKFW